MNKQTQDDGSIVIEREFHCRPEQLWRALTEPHLMEQWLMNNDFALAMGHRFSLSADWGVVACEVQAIEP
jgi:uncharacterized protein YndB with AHSA1/START domain